MTTDRTASPHAVGTPSIRPAHPTTRAALTAFATLLFFTLLAGEFWQNLIGWPAFIVLAGLLALGSIVWIAVLRPTVKFRKIPKSLMLFMALATVSIAWSFYPGASALGLGAQWAATAGGVFLALCLSWSQIIRTLGWALRLIVAGSLLFELVVAIFVRHGVVPLVLPPFGDYSGKIPEAFYWSRGLLFHGSQIQGIQGNSNILAMTSLIALIVFGVQLANRSVRRSSGITWLALAALTFVLTRSSTVIAATVLTALVLALTLWTRRRPPEKRGAVYGTAFGVIVVGVASVWLLWQPILNLLGKSDDLTGRGKIWEAVIGLAQQHPAFGWGWISYWAPWVEPFKGLAVRKGVTYLQAHNAWLDVWLQIGIVGLIIFIILVASTLGRSWFAAVDRPRTSIVDDQPFAATTLLPLLLITALIAQSAAESRILVEGGWALLVLITMKTKADRP